MMIIKQMLSQNRRDFRAIYECESCGHTHEGTGYDDSNFHVNVIPEMICSECGEISPQGYRPNVTKYPDGMEI